MTRRWSRPPRGVSAPASSGFHAENRNGFLRPSKLDQEYRPSEEVIEKRRAELKAHADATRNGFRAPIIVNGNVVAYCVIVGRQVVRVIDV